MCKTSVSLSEEEVSWSDVESVKVVKNDYNWGRSGCRGGGRTKKEEKLRDVCQRQE